MRKLLLASLMVAVLAFGVAAVTTDDATSVFNVGNNEIAVLDVSGTAGNLLLVEPATGGDAPAAVSDDTTYLQYTVVVISAATKKITAQITTGSLPTGTLLKATTAPAGSQGTLQENISVTTGDAAEVLTAISSCATGVDGTDGAKVTWTLSANTVAEMVSTEAASITITYILTDS